MLSSRAHRLDSFTYFHRPHVLQYLKEHMDEKNQLQGIVDLHRAEMKVTEDLVLQKINEVTKDIWEPYMLYYAKDCIVHYKFKKTMASFMVDYFGAKSDINPDNIVLTLGVTEILEVLAFTLADPGDTFLVPGPSYFKIPVDIRDKMEVDTELIPCPAKPPMGHSHGFQLTLEAIEETYQRAVSKGKNVKTIILVNPTNPTGVVLSRSLVQDVIHFAHKKNIHLISDEIYALSVYGDGAKFHSVLSLDIPDPEMVHFVWGPSKDFGLSGMRLGVLYTENQMLQKLSGRLTFYTPVPEVLQEVLRRILEDREWLDNVFLPQHKKNLKASFNYGRERLEKLDVKVYPSYASLFIWADFSKYLKPCNLETEFELFDKFRKKGVMISPSANMLCNDAAGWFRILATSSPKEFKQGLDSIEKVLEEESKN